MRVNPGVVKRKRASKEKKKGNKKKTRKGVTWRLKGERKPGTDQSNSAEVSQDESTQEK